MHTQFTMSATPQRKRPAAVTPTVQQPIQLPADAVKPKAKPKQAQPAVSAPAPASTVAVAAPSPASVPVVEQEAAATVTASASTAVLAPTRRSRANKTVELDKKQAAEEALRQLKALKQQLNDGFVLTRQAIQRLVSARKKVPKEPRKMTSYLLNKEYAAALGITEDRLPRGDVVARLAAYIKANCVEQTLDVPTGTFKEHKDGRKLEVIKKFKYRVPNAVLQELYSMPASYMLTSKDNPLLANDIIVPSKPYQSAVTDDFATAVGMPLGSIVNDHFVLQWLNRYIRQNELYVTAGTSRTHIQIDQTLSVLLGIAEGDYERALISKAMKAYSRGGAFVGGAPAPDSVPAAQ